jgi:hypothetical protein
MEAKEVVVKSSSRSRFLLNCWKVSSSPDLRFPSSSVPKTPAKKDLWPISDCYTYSRRAVRSKSTWFSSARPQAPEGPFIGGLLPNVAQFRSHKERR